MFYLCLAFTTAWLIYFIYLFHLDRQLQTIKKRLDAYENKTTPNVTD